MWKFWYAEYLGNSILGALRYPENSKDWKFPDFLMFQDWNRIFQISVVDISIHFWTVLIIIVDDWREFDLVKVYFILLTVLPRRRIEHETLVYWLITQSTTLITRCGKKRVLVPPVLWPRINTRPEWSISFARQSINSRSKSLAMRHSDSRATFS